MNEWVDEDGRSEGLGLKRGVSRRQDTVALMQVQLFDQSMLLPYYYYLHALYFYYTEVQGMRILACQQENALCDDK
jgi:uncharacterized membrane protein (GlpM family)